MLTRVLTLGSVLMTVVLCAVAADGPAPRPPEPAPVVPVEERYSTDDILVMVAADLTTLPAIEAVYTRYLTLRGMATKREQEDWARLTVATLHDLSGVRGIFPLITPREAAGGTLGVVRVNDVLLRINTVRFGEQFARTWERLGTQEPYWHGDDLRFTDGEEDVEIGWWKTPAGENYNGKQRSKNDVWETVRVEKRKTDKVAIKTRGFFVRTDAGKKAFQTVQQIMVDPRTGDYGTDVPVVDADWFVGQTLEDYKRDPGYHDFLGFSDLKTFQKLGGLVIDPKVIDEQFLTELREAVAHSSVTNEDVTRRIIHFDKVAGDAWFTEDSNQREANFDPAANALVNLGDDYRFQAIEALLHKANGFVLKGLFNNKGVRQDVAPDFIASDSTAPYADRRVHTGLCFRCHNRGKNAGFQSITGWVRDMANTQPNFLVVKDLKVRQKLQEQYVNERLEPFLERSRTRYSEALQRATRWKPDEYAEAIDEGWKRYVEGPVDADMAARRLGVKTDAFVDMLTAKAVQVEMKAKGKTEQEIAEAVAVVTQRMDPALAVYRPGAKAYKTLPAVVFQQAFQRAADVTAGVVRPFSIKEREGKK